MTVINFIFSTPPHQFFFFAGGVPSSIRQFSSTCISHRTLSTVASRIYSDQGFRIRFQIVSTFPLSGYRSILDTCVGEGKNMKINLWKLIGLDYACMDTD
jgi:hypothetical protein